MLLRIQRNGKELLGTRITHFELLHKLGLHDRHGVCCTGRGGGGNGARGWFGSRFSARLHSQTSWLSSWLGGSLSSCLGGSHRLLRRHQILTPPPPCASTLKVSKTTVTRAHVLRQGRACARRAVPKERMSPETCPYLTLSTIVATGHYNTMCRQISASSGGPHCPSGPSGAVE